MISYLYSPLCSVKCPTKNQHFDRRLSEVDICICEPFCTLNFIVSNVELTHSTL